MDSSLVALIEDAIALRGGEPHGREVRFRCPSHDDHEPSARWSHEKLVWYCDPCGKGGGYLNLARLLDLVDENPGLDVVRLADAKGLPADALKAWGVRDGVSGIDRTPCVDVPYLDQDGGTSSVRKRLSLSGVSRFLWRRGDKTLPYGLWDLGRARERKQILLVEGESDTWTGLHVGLPTLGLPGAGTWKEQWRGYLTGVETIYLWQEPGQGGDTFVSKISSDLPDALVVEPPSGIKDLNQLWLSVGLDRERLVKVVEGLQERARPVQELKSDELRSRARASLPAARALLDAPNLLDRVGEAIRARGFAGDLKPPLIVFIGLVSRFLARPLNLAVVAPSSAGKNRAVDAALELVPEDAYFMEKAGSARALIYSETSFKNKIVVVAEADSIPEDGPAASAVRSLVTDSAMTYDVVEKDATGKFTTRRIERQGPTGLITTSTKALPEQMNTRMLTLSVSDTPDQTRAVLLAHAAAVNGDTANFDLSGFLALQDWLESGGVHSVYIPYARRLAELAPVKFVRMRRDFRQLLTVISAVALLHQRQRSVDNRGRIIADIRDYELARSLLIDVFTAAASGGISRSVRETVEALVRIYHDKPLMQKALCDELKLDKDTVYHRVRRAIQLGLIRNLETRKGQPSQLVPGDPLEPEEQSLPLPSALGEVCNDDTERDSTVQPDSDDETSAESEPPVETSVESEIQPSLQPPADENPDSNSDSRGASVERLKDYPGQEHASHIEDDSDLVYAGALAESYDFPRLRISETESIGEGERCWRLFLARATRERLAAAIGALESLSTGAT